jgi:hypothetical protein
MFSLRLKLIIILTAVLVSAAAIPAEAQDILFIDVEMGHPDYTAIKYLKDYGLIEGYEDGSFQPAREINRAEALKILTAAFPKNTPETEENIQSGGLLFKDVKTTDWFFPHISDAYENNVVGGYPDGLFHPEKTINKAEALKIALLQEGGPLPIEVLEKPYPDVPVDIWFASYAVISAERTLFLRNRENGGLDPGQNLNRGKFAELIYRMKMSQNNSLFARATWYGNEFADWGTASGEPFDPNAFTAAHKTLPFGTELEVINMANGEKVTVKINDRGPYAEGMDLDLSRAAFEEIASLGTGIICVEFREKSNVPEYAF